MVDGNNDDTLFQLATFDWKPSEIVLVSVKGSKSPCGLICSATIGNLLPEQPGAKFDTIQDTGEFFSFRQQSVDSCNDRFFTRVFPQSVS